jgi:hypothetical protein
MTHAHLKVLEEAQSSSSVRKILCFYFALTKAASSSGQFKLASSFVSCEEALFIA